MTGSLDVPPELAGQSGLYNSVDPLLRRLRLEEPNGQSVTDIEKYFREKEVVVLYAGCEQGSQNLKELHRNLTSFALQRFKTSSVIYVSTDTNPASPQRVLAHLPWLRMTFQDDSDFAPLATAKEGAKIVEIEEVARGEDFVQAGEIEVGAEKMVFGEEEYERDYVRPLSRAAMTAIMTAYTTPSLAVYHIPSHTFLVKNARLSVFTPANIDQNYELWWRGGSSSFRIKDLLYHMRWPIFFLILAGLYRVLVQYGGDEYNVLPRALNALNMRSDSPGRVL